jgi:predicted HicB family RNase H-like nuclease
MFDPYEYSVIVRRAVVDGDTVFESTVAELPDVRGYGSSFDEAYHEAIDAIEGLHELAVRDEVQFPKPAVTAQSETLSGRITLRLPSALHRAAAEAADRQQVSLNSFISTVVAFAIADLGRFFETRMGVNCLWLEAVNQATSSPDDITPLVFNCTGESTGTVDWISAHSASTWICGPTSGSAWQITPAVSGAAATLGGIVGAAVGGVEYANMAKSPDYVAFVGGGSNRWGTTIGAPLPSYRTPKVPSAQRKGHK